MAKYFVYERVPGTSDINFETTGACISEIVLPQNQKFCDEIRQLVYYQIPKLVALISMNFLSRYFITDRLSDSHVRKIPNLGQSQMFLDDFVTK